MARQRVSDQLKHQDMRTSAGVVVILRALLERYPNDGNLIFAAKAVAEFSAGLEEKPAPFVFVPSSEATGP